MPIDLRNIQIKINHLKNPKKHLHNSPSDAQQVTLDPPGNPGITTTQIDVPSFDGRTTTIITGKGLSPSFPTLIGSFDFIPLFNQEEEATEAFEFFLLQLQMRITVMALVTRAIDNDAYGVATNSQGKAYATIVTEIRASLVALLRYWIAFIALYESLDLKSKSDTLIPDNRTKMTIPSEFFEDIATVYASFYNTTSWIDDNNPNSLTGYWNEIMGFDSTSFLSVSNSTIFAQIASELANNINYDMPYLLSQDVLLSQREGWEPESAYDNYSIKEQENSINYGLNLYNKLKTLRTSYINALLKTWGFGMPRGAHSGNEAYPRMIFDDLIAEMPTDPAQAVSFLMWFLQSESIISSKNVGDTGDGEPSLGDSIKTNFRNINSAARLYKNHNMSGYDLDVDTTEDTIRNAIVDTISTRNLSVFTDADEESIGGLARVTTSDGDTVLIFETAPPVEMPAGITEDVDGDLISGREYFLQDIAADAALDNFSNYVTHYDEKITNLNALFSNLYTPHMTHDTMPGGRDASEFINPGTGSDGRGSKAAIVGQIKDKTGASAIISMMGWLFRNWLLTVSQAVSTSYFSDKGFDLDIVVLNNRVPAGTEATSSDMYVSSWGEGHMFFSSASGTITASRASCSGHFELCLLKLCSEDNDTHNAFLEWLVTKYTWNRIMNTTTTFNGIEADLYDDMTLQPSPNIVQEQGKGPEHGLMNFNVEQSMTHALNADLGITSMGIHDYVTYGVDHAMEFESLGDIGATGGIDEFHTEGRATYKYDSLNLASMKLASMIHRSCVSQNEYEGERSGYSGTIRSAKLRNLVATGTSTEIERAYATTGEGIDLMEGQEDFLGDVSGYHTWPTLTPGQVLVFSPQWSATLNPIMTYLSECMSSLSDRNISPGGSTFSVETWLSSSTQLEGGFRTAPTLCDLPRWLLYLGRMGYYRTCIDSAGAEASELDGDLAPAGFSFNGTQTLAIPPRHSHTGWFGMNTIGDARWPHHTDTGAVSGIGMSPVLDQEIAEKSDIKGRIYMTRFRGILDQHYIALGGILLVNVFRLLGLGSEYFRFVIDGERSDPYYPNWEDIWVGPGDDKRTYNYAINGDGSALAGYRTEIITDPDGHHHATGDFHVEYLGTTDWQPTWYGGSSDVLPEFHVMVVGNDDRHGLMNLRCATKISDINKKIADLDNLIGISLWEGSSWSLDDSDFASPIWETIPSMGGLPDAFRVRDDLGDVGGDSFIKPLVDAWRQSVTPFLGIILAGSFFNRVLMALEDALESWTDFAASDAFADLDLGSLEDGIPHMIDGGTSLENVLTATVAFRNYTKQTKAWGFNTEEGDEPEPEMFYFSPALVTRPYDLTAFTALMKEDEFLASDTVLPDAISQDETKRILVIGLPLNFMTTFRSLSEACEGTAVLPQSSLIKIHINKVDLREDSLEFEEKTFLFDTRLFYKSTGGMSLRKTNPEFSWDTDHITDWVSEHVDSVEFDKDFVNDILSGDGFFTAEVEHLRLNRNTGVYEGNTFTYSDFGTDGDAYVATGYSDAGLPPIESQSIFKNHVIDFYLKYYLSLGMGVDMSEMGFFFDEDQVTLADPSGPATELEIGGVSQGDFLNDDVPTTGSSSRIAAFTTALHDGLAGRVDIVDGEEVATPVDPNLVDQFVTSAYRSTLFAMAAYKQRILLPRLFERTFAVLIDVEDFPVVSGNLPDDRAAEFYAFNVTIEMVPVQSEYVDAEVEADASITFE